MRSPRRFRSAFLAVAAVVATLATSVLGPTAAPFAGAAGKVRGPYELAPGVMLWRIRYPDPNEVRVIRIDPTVATIDVYPAAPTFGPLTTVSEQGIANGAIAAVNGDFGTFDGEPTHSSLIDADLRTSGLMPGVGFSVNRNGSRAWARWAHGSIVATTSSASFVVARLNAGAARGGEVAAFTQVGGAVERPAVDMCAAELQPSTDFRWSDAQHNGIARTYQVVQQPDPCPYQRLAFDASAPAGTVILQAKRACWCARRIMALDPGETIDLTWETWGRPGITDQIGGQPQLVRDGQNVAPGPDTSSSYFYGRNPRTGVGITAGCTDRDAATRCYVYLITVDGRQDGWSIGMTLPRFAKEFLRQRPSATWAINLDGGGGTEMWVSHRRRRPYCQMPTTAGGCTVDRPSGGHERVSITSLQVLDVPDPGEPNLTATAIASFGGTAPTPPATAVDAARAADLFAQDPGSTGGLLDAIARGGLGPVPDDPTFRTMLAIYRRALTTGLVARILRGR
jgi:Phosphodiester glycosidase